jgi:hypothetical protein
MQRIDTASKAVDLFGAGKHGYKDGNRALGIAATDFNAASFNAMQEELANVVEGFGLAIDPNDNQQMHKAIIRAMGGVLSKSVAGSAAVALTAAEAVYGILRLTGAITADIDVIVPSSPTRCWTIKNDTTGAFAITVKTAAGGGVVVAQAADTPIFTDGTDVLYDLSIVPQAEAEAGTSTTLRGWSALRIRQAINAVTSLLAPLASPALTGNPTAPTRADADNSTKIATTAWVRSAMANIATSAGFVYSMTSTGYIRLPTWLQGWTVQWGTADMASGGDVGISWPIAFTTACFFCGGFYWGAVPLCRWVNLSAGNTGGCVGRAYDFATGAAPIDAQIVFVTIGK